MGKKDDKAILKKSKGGFKKEASIGAPLDLTLLQRKNPTPLNGGVSMGAFEDTKDDGVVIRGCKNTERGKKARGPMA